MSKKKVLAAVLCLVLVAGLVGGTLAYLSQVTNVRNNVFTFAGLTAKLIEPKWDAQPGTTPDANGDKIPDKAKNMMPGSSVDKDPRIQNTCDIDEYVAIRVTFKDGEGNTLTQGQMTELLKIIEIRTGNDTVYTSTFNTTDWTIRSGDANKPVQIWYYENATSGIVLPKQTTTDDTDISNSLFDYIYVKTGANDNANMLWLNTSPSATNAAEAAINGAMPIGGLQIKLEGAAVQSDDITWGDAKIALTNLFPAIP